MSILGQDDFRLKLDPRDLSTVLSAFQEMPGLTKVASPPSEPSALPLPYNSFRRSQSSSQQEFEIPPDAPPALPSQSTLPPPPAYIAEGDRGEHPKRKREEELAVKGKARAAPLEFSLHPVTVSPRRAELSLLQNSNLTSISPGGLFWNLESLEEMAGALESSLESERRASLQLSAILFSSSPHFKKMVKMIRGVLF